MNEETSGLAIEEFVGLKAKICLFLVDDNRGHKKAKGANRNVIANMKMYC